MAVARRIGSQDISWFLDQHHLKRLDLNPRYQRKSVWTSGDRRDFLDTIFKGFPCPPVYLHKTIDAKGEAIYHVVDGKQRIETVIRFATENRLRIPFDFGDSKLDKKRWKDIKDDPELRNLFLNYTFIVEYFDIVDTELVKEIFERMNKNSRKLTRQELRHARFEGWFSKQVERELDEPFWKEVGVVTTSKARRMADAQFIAELLILIIEGDIVGFDQDHIDEMYANYDDLADLDTDFDVEAFSEKLTRARQRLKKLNDVRGHVQKYASTSSNLYTLWALLATAAKLQSPGELSTRYGRFMAQVTKLGQKMKGDLIPDDALKSVTRGYSAAVVDYYQNNQSATTEPPQRRARLKALQSSLLS